MSYITKYLSDKDTLKLELERYPNNIKYYAKYEAFIGNSDAIHFLKSKIKEYLTKS